SWRGQLAGGTAPRVEKQRAIPNREKSPQRPETSGPAATRSADAAFRFQLAGDIWEVRFADESGKFRNTHGMQYIAELLRRPNRPTPALELRLRVAGIPRGSKRDSQAVEDYRAQFEDSGDDGFQPLSLPGDPVLDDQGLSQVRARLREIDAGIKKAQTDRDFTLMGVYQNEKDKLSEYLRKSMGLYGRVRPIGPGSGAEKARVAVKKALSRAYDVMRTASPPLKRLVQHLEDTIKTEGTSYVYRPDPP